ncbi:hypothetical protein M5D96_011511, partial [Drosophila gunungcola]
RTRRPRRTCPDNRPWSRISIASLCPIGCQIIFPFNMQSGDVLTPPSQPPTTTHHTTHRKAKSLLLFHSLP